MPFFFILSGIISILLLVLEVHIFTELSNAHNIDSDDKFSFTLISIGTVLVLIITFGLFYYYMQHFFFMEYPLGK